jgi:hypothetical protein
MKLQNPTQEHTCCPAFDQFVRNLNNFNLQNAVASQSGASLQKVPSDTAGAWQHVVLQLISFCRIFNILQKLVARQISRFFAESSV